MKNESRKSSKTILKMVLVCLTMSIAFTVGMFLGTYRTTEKLNNEKDKTFEAKVEEAAENDNMFMDGVLAGMDYMSISMMHEFEMITEQEYTKLNEVLEEYISNPTEENHDKWYEVFKKTMLGEDSNIFNLMK